MMDEFEKSANQLSENREIEEIEILFIAILITESIIHIKNESCTSEHK